MTDANAGSLVGATHPIIVVGDEIGDTYEPADIVTLADATTADVLTVGDEREILPHADETACCVGRLDDNLELVHAADCTLVVGLDIPTANRVPWAAFGGDGIVVTSQPFRVYRDAVGDLPFDSWVCNADASTLGDLTAAALELASPPDPATVYSESKANPDPPAELRTTQGATPAVKQCEVCHSLSNNRTTIGNSYPGSTTEWQCPASRHRNHDRLETLLNRREYLEFRRSLYDETADAREQALARLDDEHARLTEEIETLRGWFDGRFDDVVGADPAPADVVQFEPREADLRS